MITRLRWELHSLGDWFMVRGCLRIAGVLDRVALALWRLQGEP